ncbi:hypothetical protein K1719_022802 [Acacia pycnantha]|nr:hypothetical protein K1719_022802 [Acacia pycnantha]
MKMAYLSLLMLQRGVLIFLVLGQLSTISLHIQQMFMLIEVEEQLGLLPKVLLQGHFSAISFRESYMPEVLKRLSITRQIDKVTRKDSQAKFPLTPNSGLNEPVQELNALLSRPLQSKQFSHRYLAGAGVTPLMQEQFQQLVKKVQE